MPLSAAVNGPPFAATDTEAGRDPVVLGVKVTLIVQLALTAKLPGQVLVCE